MYQKIDRDNMFDAIWKFPNNLSDAIDQGNQNIKKIRCLGSYYRLDLGKTLWPPGTGF